MEQLKKVLQWSDPVALFKAGGEVRMTAVYYAAVHIQAPEVRDDTMLLLLEIFRSTP